MRFHTVWQHRHQTRKLAYYWEKCRKTMKFHLGSNTATK
jgi:hypothetical protein